MKEFIVSFRNFDAFVKMQLLSIAVASFSWALIIPIITKLQGTLWTTYVIAGFMILVRTSAFISPFFKHISLKRSYEVIVILTAVYLFSLLTYFHNVYLFLIIEMLLMFGYGIIFSIYSINYDMYIMKQYKPEVFRDIQYLEQMIMAASSIAGFVITGTIDLISNSIETSLYCFMFMLVVSLGVDIYNYKKYWTEMV